jgi:N-acylneuraminate cytidylyltransferase/CMP-N,N'-diacetyllegionaminic acid synthase
MDKEFDTLALICARGGSKGIPNKNIRKFHGKPLLGWTVEAARHSGEIDRVIVSTDSPKIAEVASKYGAEVPDLRPSHLVQDDSDQFDTHAYVFDKLDLTDDNCRVFILVNNPYLSPDLIKKMSKKANDCNYERLVTTVIHTRHPFYFQFIGIDETAVPQFKDKYLKAPINRQDREIVYFPFFLGCAGKPSMLRSWKAYKKEMARGFIPVVLNKKEAFDLDDEEDWQIAEIIFNAFHIQSGGKNENKV